MAVADRPPKPPAVFMPEAELNEMDRQAITALLADPMRRQELGPYLCREYEKQLGVDHGAP